MGAVGLEGGDQSGGGVGRIGEEFAAVVNADESDAAGTGADDEVRDVVAVDVAGGDTDAAGEAGAGQGIEAEQYLVLVAVQDDEGRVAGVGAGREEAAGEFRPGDLHRDVRHARRIVGVGRVLGHELIIPVVGNRHEFLNIVNPSAGCGLGRDGRAAFVESEGPVRRRSSVGRELVVAVTRNS